MNSNRKDMLPIVGFACVLVSAGPFITRLVFGYDWLAPPYVGHINDQL